MASTTQRALLTEADYLLMPEGGPRYQLIEGDLLQMTAPNRFHQEIVGNLHALLWLYLRQNPIGKVFVSPFDAYLDDINVLQPDLLYVSNQRLERLSKRGIEGGPDLVVEVLSPSTEKLDAGPKRRVYANHGVQELWLINPDTLTINVYRDNLAAEPVADLSGDAVLQSPLLTNFSLKAQEVFAV